MRRQSATLERDARSAARRERHARPIVVWEIAFIALIVALARLPSLMEPHHYGDEGIFAAVGQRLLQGHPLYAGAWDDKPPLVYWLYAAILAVAGPSMPALRLAAMVATMLAAVAVYIIGRELHGRVTGLIAGAIFATVSSLPMVEGNLALTELFGAAPAAGGMALVLTARATRPARLAAAGLCLATAALFKQVFGLDAAAAALYLLFSGQRGLSRAGALAAGFTAPVLATGAVLAVQGALGDALFAVFGFYAIYLREGSALPPTYTMVKLIPPVLALTTVIWLAHRRTTTATDLLALWLGFATLGATLASRPFGHYLVQALAPLTLSVVLIVAVTRQQLWMVVRARPPLLLTTCAAVISLVSAFSGFWWSYPLVTDAYYDAIRQRLRGRLSQESFEWFFSWRAVNQGRLAAIIRADDERSLFVWGEYPWLYPLAGAENPTRYVTSYHTSFVPGAKTDVMATLHRAPPRYIVWEREEWRRLPGLHALLAERYEPVAEVDNSTLYRRLDP